MTLAKGNGYRLPTEAEWEYACRAGSEGKYSFGDNELELGQYAWYHSNSGRMTHPVGGKPPNGFGLYDMYGNVWEWCQDWYDWEYYEQAPSDDPKGPVSGTRHVMRGGSFSQAQAVRLRCPRLPSTRRPRQRGFPCGDNSS